MGDFIKRQWQGIIAGFVLGALAFTIFGTLRPPA